MKQTMLAEPLPKPTKDDFHVERSRFLDAFAALEEAISRSKQTDETLLKELKALRLIRNDLVHAQLKFVQFEGQIQTVVVNSQCVDAPVRHARVFRIHELKSLSADLGRLKKGVAAA